jgi:hypothetical protein
MFQVICLINTFPNPHYNNKLEIGSIYTVVGEDNVPITSKGKEIILPVYKLLGFVEVPPHFLNLWHKLAFATLNSGIDEMILSKTHSEKN